MRLKMNQTTYNGIIEKIKLHKNTSKCMEDLTRSFKNVNYHTLYSILSTEYQKKMKLNHQKTQVQKNKFWEIYKTAVNNRESPQIILRIAWEAEIAPCLVAKLILQKYFETFGTDDSSNNNLNVYMRDTTLIPDMDLAYEIFLCTLHDNLYSPLSETLKHSLGQQYEIHLYKQVKELGLAFRDEEELRKYGYDKTPDIKLEVPIAIDGFIVNWIESKALFADEYVHKDYMRNQYLSYWNRFGSGLVIYWFGFLENIVDNFDKKFIIRDHLPLNITRMTYCSTD